MAAIRLPAGPEARSSRSRRPTGRWFRSAAACGLLLCLSPAAPLAAAPIDDVRSAVGAPLAEAEPAAVAEAVRAAVLEMPPENLERAIDLVGAVSAEIGDRQAAAEIAGAAQGAIDTLAERHPHAIEEWWASIVKESILSVAENPTALAAPAEEAAADATAEAAAPAAETDIDLRLVTDPALDGAGMAADAPPPVDDLPVRTASPRRQPEEPPSPPAEPPASASPPPADADPPATPVETAAVQPEAAPESELSPAAKLLLDQGRPITTDNLNRAMRELAGDCEPLELEALRAAARYGRCREALARRLAEVAPAAGGAEPASAPDPRAAFRNMINDYAAGRRGNQTAEGAPR